MIIKLLNFLFSKLIGKLPEDKKKKYLEEFKKLLSEVVKSAAEGAVQGATNEIKNR